MSNPYANAAREVASAGQQQRAAAVVLSEDTTPDQQAEVVDLASRTALPLGAVKSDPKAVRRDVERQQLDQLAQDSPLAAQWAAQPDNFAVARDDLDTLGRIHRIVRMPVDAAQAFTAAIPRTVGATLEGGAEMFDAVGRRGARSLEAMLGLEATMQPLDQRLGNPSNLARRAGQGFKSAASAIDIPVERQNLATDIAGGVGQLGTQVVQAFVAPPTVLPSLFAQGADQMAERVRETDTVGTTEGDIAILGGAALTGLMERLGLDQLIKRLPPKIRNDITRRIVDTAAAGGIEAAQEVAEGLSQDVLTRALLDEDYAIGEGIMREAQAAGGAGAIARLAVQYVGGRRAHRQAQTERAMLDELVETGQASRTRTRSPQAFEDFVESVAEDQAVYVPLDALQAHYGARTAQAVADLTGDPNAYTEAAETGIEVSVPMSRYAARMTREGHAAIAGQVRTQPGEDVKPDALLPDRETIEADIEAGLAEARAEEGTAGEQVIGRNTGPLVTDPSLMAAGTYAEYLEASAAAERQAVEAREAERLRKQQRTLERLQGAQRAQVQAEVEAELQKHPIYRARRLLLLGRNTKGDPAENPVKLDLQAVVDAYGQATADQLKGMTRKHGGATPDEAAALLGYGSGAQLVHELTTAPALADIVRVETDARLQAQEGPVEIDRTEPEVDSQADIMLREIQALEARNGGIRTHGQVLKAVAQRLIDSKPVHRVQPHLYRQAEAKAGREAYHAASKQDWRAAAAARRRQLQNLYLYRAARDAREASTSTGKYLAQFGKAKTRAALGKAGGDYLEQIDALLARFDFRPLTTPQMERRQSLTAWVRAKAEQGIVIDLPPTIADEAFRRPFKRLTVGELRELREAVQHIAHMANEANFIRIGEEQFERRVVDESMAMAVLDGNRAITHRAGDPTFREKARSQLLEARTLTGAATDIARELDGFKDGGAVWDHTVRVLRKANDRVNLELQAAQTAYADLKLQHYTKGELRAFKDPVFVPELQDSWSKGRILSLALNWGNAGNREAILTQATARLTPEQVGILLGKLDARDWQFVQGVWAQIDGYWPQIEEVHKRRKGLAPEKVERSPFTVRTADGQNLTIAGGYYPLKYAPDSVKTMREASSDFFDAIRTGRFAKASTKAGHAEERIGSGGRTVVLEMGVVTQHLRDVIRDIHLGDSVNFVYQALRGQEFGKAARDTGTVELVRGLDTWLRDVASGEIGLRRADERLLRLLRTNFTAAVLIYKFVSAALQVTGVIQSSVVLGKADMLHGITQFVRRPRKTYRHAVESSDFMRARMQTHVEAVQRVMDAEAGTFSAGQAAMIRKGYWMIGRVQATVDVATWLAAEKQGLEKFGDLEKARAFADDVVARAQGSGDFIDKTALQRGTLGDGIRQSEYIRTTTTLMGYMMAKSNVAYERVRTRKGFKLAEDLVALMVLEAMVVAVIRGQMPGDEDEDGSTVDDWLALAAQEGAANLFGGLPGLSQGVSELRGYDAKGIVASAWESVGRAIAQAQQGELDKAAIKSGVTLSGFAFGVPSSQINKTIDALAKAQDGEEVTPYEYVAGPRRD